MAQRICCPKDIQQTFERGSTYGLGRGFSVKSRTSLDLPPSLPKNQHPNNYQLMCVDKS
jgi:hypothetical protein